MSDETVPAGELVLTSGGDGVFPKGLLVGRVTKVSAGNDLFLNIHVRPAADLSKLEEVLVVTKIDERQTEPDQTGEARAVDILAERLPTVPTKLEPPEKAKTASPSTESAQAGTGQPGSNVKPKAAPTTAVSGTTPVAGKTPADKTGAARTTSEGGSTTGSGS